MRSLTHANPSLLAHRLWLGDDHDEQTQHLKLIQQAAGNVSPDLLVALHGRRAAAADRVAEPSRQVTITPLWRLVVGHGEGAALESGLTMSSTYGVPIIPGSALKGACAAQARREALPDAALLRCFGGPRPGGSSEATGRGSVRFWDALPVSVPRLVLDVLTPHVKPYYDQANSGNDITQPPAEYHNPIPVRFLAVEGTPFRAVLTGPAPDIDTIVELLRGACDDWGLGGKTSAGYGYCDVSEDA